ncbi:cell envelope integrity protein TolA [Silvibacterium sp.]|uniref:cell envelope integrity protein TolA n=1 Tax=Silvibacterium sp. TaxID=1964179 RepID=UPI0039E688AD
MPITEVPNSPSGAPPEPPRSRRSSRDYEDLDIHDLLGVIEELEGDRNWAALREKIWIALIVHMVIFWFIAYGPRYLFNVHVKDPSVVLRDRDKQMTYLTMPKDLLKQPKPKDTNKISDQNHIQQSPKPSLDRKTLRQLQQMRQAQPAPPAPQPAPQPPQPQPQQQAENQPKPQPTPPAQPLPNNQQAKSETPSAPQPKPNFSTNQGTLGQQMQELARGARPSGGQFSGGAEGDDAQQQGGNQGAVTILSDTMGVDFGPYIQRVIYDTKRAWYPIIPEEARPPLNKQGRVAIRFKILPDGSVKEMVLEGPSGDVSLDRSAWGGITGASPYPNLPKNFKGPFLELRFWFLYNLEPGQQR